MPRIKADVLHQLTHDCFHAAGFPAEEAEQIAHLMVLANLRGHESHGVRQLPRYLQRVRDKQIVPGAPVTVVKETATTAVLDGHRTLGHVAATQAARVGIAKAREMKVSAVAVHNLDHIGRIGAYPEMAAREDMIGLCFVSAHGPGRTVTPFGGIQGMLGTNPFSAGFPYRDGDGPILLDFATSIVAANKVTLAHDRQVETGEGWIVDLEGNPTRDPQRYVDKQALINPLGGEKGYKGYAMAVMNEILSGILTGAGTAATAGGVAATDNVTFMVTIDPLAFVSREYYDKEMKALVDYLHSTKVRPGDPAVLVPGEYEWTRQQQREAQGVDLEEGVWRGILKAAEQMGVAVPVPTP